MAKTEMIDNIAKKVNMSKTQVKQVVDAIFDSENGAIAEAVRSNGKFALPGFGSFQKSTRAARTGRNPQTGDTINIPESTSCSFRAGKSLKDSLSK